MRYEWVNVTCNVTWLEKGSVSTVNLPFSLLTFLTWFLHYQHRWHIYWMKSEWWSEYRASSLHVTAGDKWHNCLRLTKLMWVRLIRSNEWWTCWWSGGWLVSDWSVLLVFYVFAHMFFSARYDDVRLYFVTSSTLDGLCLARRFSISSLEQWPWCDSPLLITQSAFASCFIYKVALTVFHLTPVQPRQLVSRPGLFH